MMHEIHPHDPGEAAIAVASCAPPVLYREDVWTLAGLHMGRKLRCTSATTALHYARAKRTEHVGMKRYDKATSRRPGHMDVQIKGPVADDGERLYVLYRIHAPEWNHALCDRDRAAWMEILGAEPGGRGPVSVSMRAAGFGGA